MRVIDSPTIAVSTTPDGGVCVLLTEPDGSELLRWVMDTDSADRFTRAVAFAVIEARMGRYPKPAQK